MQRDVSLLGVLTAVFFLLSVNALLLDHENSFYLGALEKTRVTERVVVNGHAYLVENGAVSGDKEIIRPYAALDARRVAYAKAVAKRNPILALAGADLTQLERNASLLPDLESGLVSINASDTNATLIHSLYPEEFLLAITKQEAARRQFIQSGSDADLAKYNDATKAAFAQYQKSADNFSLAFTKAVPTTIGKYATNNDIISRAEILAGVQTLKAAAKKKEAAFKQLLQCERGETSKCDLHALSTLTVTVPQESAIPPAYLAQAKAVRSLIAEAHGQAAIAEGPMYFVPGSLCTKDMKGAPLFVFYIEHGSKSYTGLFPYHIGNIRYITTEGSPDSPYNKYLLTLTTKIKYVLHLPLVHYSCPEIGQDTSRLYTMKDAYVFAKANNLSALATTSTSRATLAALERPNLSVVSEHMVAAYLQQALLLPLIEPVKSQVEEMALAYTNNTYRFDALVGNILNDEVSNLDLVKHGFPTDLHTRYLFAIRSSFNTLLLADNQSAVGLTSSLFSPNTIPLEKQPYLFYSDLPHTASVHAQIVKDIAFTFLMHVEANVAPIYTPAK